MTCCNDEIENRIYIRSWSILPQGWIPKPNIPHTVRGRKYPSPTIFITDSQNFLDLWTDRESLIGRRTFAETDWRRPCSLISILLHCVLSLTAQCIVIGLVCGFVWVCVCGFFWVWLCYHDNSKLLASIFTKLGLRVKVLTISSWLNFGRPAPPEGRGVCGGMKILAPPYYGQCTVFTSLRAFFSFRNCFGFGRSVKNVSCIVVQTWYLKRFKAGELVGDCLFPIICGQFASELCWATCAVCEKLPRVSRSV